MFYDIILLLTRCAIMSGFSVCSTLATLYPLSMRLAEKRPYPISGNPECANSP